MVIIYEILRNLKGLPYLVKVCFRIIDKNNYDHQHANIYVIYTTMFNREKALLDLEENGFTVINDVLTEEDCDNYSSQYKTWAQQFADNETTFMSFESLVQSYRIGHFDVTWQVRLNVRDVFAQLWETDKLLTSVDGIAVSPPPETIKVKEGYISSRPKFRDTSKNWLHLDQGADRKGLHAYQGGVYLENSTEQDHCFRVLKGSNKLLSKFYEEFPNAAKSSRKFEFYRLSKNEVDWYLANNCEMTTVPVTKGGIVLWDSRTVHDNAKPVQGRSHPDRWRHVVFVSMTPARWAKQSDLQTKRKAYEELLMTTHWASQKVSTFPAYIPHENGTIRELFELPDIAKTIEAKQLMGIEPYDFEDGQPNGPKDPEWDSMY